MGKRDDNKVLDDLNWKILKELQLNSRITAVELGKRIGLSAPAVAERIRKLEDDGVIIGYRTVVDYDRLMLTVPVFINFKATKINHSEAVKLVEKMPEVMEWHATTGNFCTMLKVVVSSTKQLEETIEYLQKYGETSTSLILSGNQLPKIVTKENK